VNIYFAGSIRGEAPDRAWFKTLIGRIGRHGRVLTEHSFGYSPEDEGSNDASYITAVADVPAIPSVGKTNTIIMLKII
jgi:hypothetical protein